MKNEMKNHAETDEFYQFLTHAIDSNHPGYIVKSRFGGSELIVRFRCSDYRILAGKIEDLLGVTDEE